MDTDNRPMQTRGFTAHSSGRMKHYFETEFNAVLGQYGISSASVPFIMTL